MRTDAHKSYLWRFASGLLSVGVAFFAMSLLASDVMSLDQYGAMASAIPAGIWALGFVAASGLVLQGLHINGRKPKFTPLIRLLGLLFLLMLFAVLTLSALTARGGDTIVVFSALFFIPHLLHFIRADLRLLIMRWGAVRHDP